MNNEKVDNEEYSELTETTDEIERVNPMIEDNGQYRTETGDKRGDSLDEEPVTEENVEEKIRRATRMEMIQQNAKYGEKWESQNKIKAIKEITRVRVLRELKKKEKKGKPKEEKKPRKEDEEKVNGKMSIESVMQMMEMMNDNETRMYITIEKGKRKVRFEIN